MTKSIFGLKLSAIAILIFVICFFGSTEVLILLGAFAFVAGEKPLVDQTGVPSPVS